MEWSKIKNIVLLILAALNIILLCIVLYRQQEARRYETELRASTVAVLADKGISVDEDTIPWEDRRATHTVRRSLEEEAALAEQMLGVCQLADTSPYTYANAVGSVRFRTNGEFVLQYEGDSPFGLAEQGAEAVHAGQVLEKLGLAAEIIEVRNTEGSIVEVSARQVWDSGPLFDCVSVLEYRSGQLRQVSGKRLFGTPDSGGQQSLTAASLLMGFMGELVSSGQVCNEITGVETGYTMTATLHDAAVLKPVWYITANTGLFELDAMTGSFKKIT
ncbi:MAG: hypothetical protein HFF18_07550 [Oscillospiraceae bacterium]|nr:hypothetical protein [Oscillospiraceae bacterium]